ncbi:MAG TPA: sugar ABC transporter substrate-binding protein [Magnetospirillaceae bacterium]|jgi:simple sugar transport system substrate-binding protein
MRKLRLLAVAAAVTAFAGSAPAFADAQHPHFVFVSHAPDSDSWWNVIKNGLKVAAKQMDATVDYRNPQSGDLADMARIIQQATASNPDGIMSTIADFNVLQGPLSAVVKKGIPLITVNSGTIEQSQKIGALLHVGQPEYDAGLAAGKRAKAEGGKNFLCVNHYISNTASVDRCKGFADGLGVPLGDHMLDSGMDPTSVKTRVSAYLHTHPDTDTIISLGPNSAEPTIDVIKEQHLNGKVHFGTFDLSAAISAAIKDGTIEYAIDQQPYLQAYLPVVLLANYVRYGVIPPNSINSGPGFVTKENIGVVEKLAGEYR